MNKALYASRVTSQKNQLNVSPRQTEKRRLHLGISILYHWETNGATLVLFEQPSPYATSLDRENILFNVVTAVTRPTLTSQSFTLETRFHSDRGRSLALLIRIGRRTARIAELISNVLPEPAAEGCCLQLSLGARERKEEIEHPCALSSLPPSLSALTQISAL